jgi:hypothetical protein
MGLKGTFAELPLTDLIEMTSLGGKTGRLLLYDEEGEVAGEMVFDGGRLADATCGELEPEKAFFALLALEDGSFLFESAEGSVSERRCDLPTTSLLIDGMRRLDETRQLRRDLPATSVVRWQGGIPEDFAEASVLGRLAAGASTLGEITEGALEGGEVDEHDVLKAVQRLSERGVVRIEPDSPAAGEGSLHGETTST